MPEFSDFIIFVDESGDHGLAAIDPQFPVFTLAFCIVEKTAYIEQVAPAFQRFKFEFWGHDGVVLHEHELRKSTGPFGFLRADKVRRELFMERLNGLVEAAPFEIYAVTIRKQHLQAKYAKPYNPYEIGLRFCMEYLLSHQLRHRQAGRHVQVQFESRGNREDGELEFEFLRICQNQGWGWKKDTNFSQLSFEPIFLSKACNSPGLQLADLVARPIALTAVRPGQANRAFDIIRPKLLYHKVFP